MSGSIPVIEVEDLVVEYGSGSKKTRAVDGLSFRVNAGECVGFIGANGAGKSTTMKTLMGFIFPTSGTARVFGAPASEGKSRERIGYLPEVALYYQFMKARELLELYGGLHGLSRADLKTKIPAILEKVGLAGRGESLLKNFSKGMQQRLGIAQSLIAEPEALFFDELSSGLDPIGRYELRDLLVELKEQGRTIFFSSHELSEVESLCDRALIIHRGRAIQEGTVDDLLRSSRTLKLEFKIKTNDLERIPDSLKTKVTQEGSVYTIVLEVAESFPEVAQALTQAGASDIRPAIQNNALEEYYMKLVRDLEKDMPAGNSGPNSQDSKVG
jgi:ABC-2 type transport system ATP-binding protein